MGNQECAASTVRRHGAEWIVEAGRPERIHGGGFIEWLQKDGFAAARRPAACLLD